jgi:hypothetical protein
MKTRFSKHNKYDAQLLPMIEYFNNVEDEKFLMIVEYLSKGWGFGLKNRYSCSFIDDGVKFIDANGVQGKSVVLSYVEFHEFFDLVCKDFLNENDEKKSEINTCLENFKEKFL